MSIVILSRKDAGLVLEYRARMAAMDEATETLYQRRAEYMRCSAADGAVWGVYKAAFEAKNAATALVDALADDISRSSIPEAFDFMTSTFAVDDGIDPQGRLL